jgi:signal transduction histidine kinase
MFALFSFALAENTVVRVIAMGTPERLVLAERLAGAGLVLAFALLVDFAVTATRPYAARQLRTAAYLAAAALGGLDVAGFLHETGGIVEPRGGDLELYAPSLTALGGVTYAFGVAASGVTFFLFARAYRRGRTALLPMVVGSAVLALAVLHDAAVAARLLGSSYFATAGFVAFVAAFSATSSGRLAELSRTLDRRSRALEKRATELGRSYEELRRAQEELVRKEQLAVVGELAAVIAHEVRNPLAIIANAVAGLRKATISRTDHETLLTILDEEASRLNRLVTDLLRYARPVNVQRSQISLDDVLDRALGPIKARQPAVAIELDRRAASPRIWGDPNLLRQVFDNLIDNAVQAMNGQGSLTLRTHTATEDGVDELAVEIVDTGEGMDTQVRSRAKDPFFTTRPSGTGLGLAIVDRIVDAHGGRLVIDSHAGEGTTVTVFLPFGSSSEPPPKPRPARKTPAEEHTPSEPAPAASEPRPEVK